MAEVIDSSEAVRKKNALKVNIHNQTERSNQKGVQIKNIDLLK